MPFGRKSPLEALALPGVILAYKYSQFRQRRREAASRRVTERELAALHHKIDKLLNKLEESEPDPPTSQEDECVICINARATMQTSPCGHRVVCRRCFVKTIQSAVAQRLLPLRCVICRARVNRLTSSSGTWRIQESASSYSMGAKSWASAGVAAGGVPASASSYSMGDTPCSSGASGHPHHPHHTQGFHQPLLHPRYAASSASSSVGGPRSPHGRVPQSASLYSMSSTGSSSLSGVSHLSGYSKTSSVSSGLCGSPLSPAGTGGGGGGAPTSAATLNNHLAPPTITHASTSLSSPSASSGGSISPRDPPSTPSLTHSHHSGCPSGCSGAIPRKPLNSLSNSSSSGSCSSSSGYGGGGGHYATSNDSSPTAYCPTPLPGTGTYPGRRHTKGRLMDLQNRLPPIKEFRSPAKVPHPSPVHVSNPRFRYASYTKSSSAHEMAPLLREPPSPPKRPMNIQITTSLTTLGPPPLKAIGSKVSPMTSRASLPKNAYLPSGKEKKQAAASGGKEATRNATSAGNLSLGASKKYSLEASAASAKAPKAAGLAGPAVKASSAQTAASSAKTAYATCSSSRSFPLFSSKEKSDNKKNESMERKKKDEKLKLKAEKEARKEEKRLAKEEERLAKILAKEEKKKGKKEAKELLLANDGNNKK